MYFLWSIQAHKNLFKVSLLKAIENSQLAKSCSKLEEGQTLNMFLASRAIFISNKNLTFYDLNIKKRIWFKDKETCWINQWCNDDWTTSSPGLFVFFSSDAWLCFEPRQNAPWLTDFGIPLKGYRSLHLDKKKKEDIPLAKGITSLSSNGMSSFFGFIVVCVCPWSYGLYNV